MTAPPATRNLAPMPATAPPDRDICNRRDGPAPGPSEWPETAGSSAARFDPDSDGTHAYSGTGDVRTDRPRAFGLFVAVEGVTGVGKTTLARKLTRALPGTLVLDPFDANPFLEPLLRSERPDNASALRVELTFVALRIAQLREIGQALSSGRTVIADWALIKQAIFAATTLPPVDVVWIAETVELWSRGVPQPDVLIGMSARRPPQMGLELENAVLILPRLVHPKRAPKRGLSRRQNRWSGRVYRWFAPGAACTCPSGATLRKRLSGFGGDLIDHVRLCMPQGLRCPTEQQARRRFTGRPRSATRFCL